MHVTGELEKSTSNQLCVNPSAVSSTGFKLVVDTQLKRMHAVLEGARVVSGKIDVPGAKQHHHQHLTYIEPVRGQGTSMPNRPYTTHYTHTLPACC